MEKEDLKDFREAIVRMSDEDDETRGKNVDVQEQLLEEYQQEASQLEQENIQLKMENTILSSSVDNGLEGSNMECYIPEISGHSMAKEVNIEQSNTHDNNYDKDDLSSIFSEDEEELRSLVEGNDTIKKALKNLRRERDFWITDTASETSDDGDTSVSARSFRDTAIDKIQISKLLADKEFLELKLSQVTSEKVETETKLRYLEKEKVGGAPRYVSSSLKDPKYLHNGNSGGQFMRLRKEDHQNKPAKLHTHRQKARPHSNRTAMNDAELLHFLKSRSISPQLVKGYESDIALLAEENEKLGEIIDHLHINPDIEEIPMLDPMEAFMDAFENRVPKEEYLRLENEKIKLEHILREKDRQIKERDRIIEESKFDHEDELKLQKETLKRMEEKVREKVKEVNECEIQIIEVKSTFEDQLANIENELSMENEQKMRLEEINMGLADSNRKLQKEIENQKNHIAKLQAREKEIEKRYSNDLRMLEEKYLNESREKNHLSGNLEGLMSDLMGLKNRLLEESGKTGKMRQEFEKERTALGGAPLPVNSRIGKLPLGVHLRNRMAPESKDQSNLRPEVGSYSNKDYTESMVPMGDSSLYEQEEFQQPDVSKYEAKIEEQKEKIEALEKANQRLKYQEQQYIDEGSIRGVQNEEQIDIKNNKSSQPTSALKHKIDELEQENAYLKQKTEELGKEKKIRRELEEKNEELHEEISQMSRKRNDLQKKQDSMNNEIEEMNEKVEELEKNNARLVKEAEKLTNRIQEMEEKFNEEKANLTSKFEKQNKMTEKELNQALEKEQERYKEKEEEIENTRDEISTLLSKIKDMENQHSNNMDTIRAKSNEEVEIEKEKVCQLQEEVRKKADAVEKVTEEWGKLLKNTVKKYEEELKRSEEEKRKITETKGSEITNFGQNQSYIRNYESLKKPDEIAVDNAYLTCLTPENLQLFPSNMQDAITCEKPLVESNIPALSEKAICAEKEMLLEGKTPSQASGERVEERIPVFNKVNVTESKPDSEKYQAGNGIEFEYTSMMPNLQIQVELEDKPEEDKSGHRVGRNDEERIRKLEGERKELQNVLNQKQNEINSLSGKIGQLEQQLVRKDQELLSLLEQVKNDNNIQKNKLEENSKYYQGMLETLKEKLQNEKKELEERLSKESEEMQKAMKEEFQNNLSSRSAVLENKIQDLVADKVRSYKDQVQKLELQLQNEKEKLAGFEKSKDDTIRRLEREKKLLRVTIDALTKELNKAKQDKKDVKKEYKKAKAGMQKASDEEKKTFTESLERAKEVQKLKIEEELRAKYRIDVEKYEQKLETLNNEIQQYETKTEDMIIKFKEEKFKLENDLQDALLELESVKEDQKEFRISLEEEYRRKLRKEKENIESTLDSLRQEITRLREHRMQLESQLQQHARYQSEKDSGYNTTHAQITESILNNKEIFTRIENEYQNQLQKEKEFYENKIRELEKDYETLSDETSHLKIKYRQERTLLRTEFENERRDLEDRFEREKRDLQQTSMQMRMQNLRDPRVGPHVDRSGNLVLQHRRLQSEVDFLQEKVSRLESLSPRLIDMAQRSSFYGGQATATSVRSTAQSQQLQFGLHDGTAVGDPNLYQNDKTNEQMIQSSNRGDINTQYSGMYVNNQQGILQERSNNLEQPVSNSSILRCDATVGSEAHQSMGNTNEDSYDSGEAVMNSYSNQGLSTVDTSPQAVEE